MFSPQLKYCQPGCHYYRRHQQQTYPKKEPVLRLAQGQWCARCLGSLDADEVFLLPQEVDGIQEKVSVTLQVEVTVAGEIAVTKHQKMRLAPSVGRLGGLTS